MWFEIHWFKKLLNVMPRLNNSTLTVIIINCKNKMKGDKSMGRHFEVRAAAMQKTANAKAKIYSRYSKEILVAAKTVTLIQI